MISWSIAFSRSSSSIHFSICVEAGGQAEQVGSGQVYPFEPRLFGCCKVTALGQIGPGVRIWDQTVNSTIVHIACHPIIKLNTWPSLVMKPKNVDISVISGGMWHQTSYKKYFKKKKLLPAFRVLKKFGIAKKRLWWLTAFHILKLLFGWIHLPVIGKKPAGPCELSWPPSRSEAESSMGRGAEAAAPWPMAVPQREPQLTFLPAACYPLTFWLGTPDSSYWRLHSISGYWVHMKLYWMLYSPSISGVEGGSDKLDKDANLRFIYNQTIGNSPFWN